MQDNIAVFATIIVMLPMMYFFMAAPAFLLVKLEIRPVAQLMRAMFNGYFLALVTAGAIGTIAVAAEGRMVPAIGIGLVAAFAVSSRRWFLQQMDTWLAEKDGGGADGARELRKLHWSGMVGNALQLVVVVASINTMAIT